MVRKLNPHFSAFFVNFYQINMSASWPTVGGGVKPVGPKSQLLPKICFGGFPHYGMSLNLYPPLLIASPHQSNSHLVGGQDGRLERLNVAALGLYLVSWLVYLVSGRRPSSLQINWWLCWWTLPTLSIDWEHSLFHRQSLAHVNCLHSHGVTIHSPF